jgi:hypothetical protein
MLHLPRLLPIAAIMLLAGAPALAEDNAEPPRLGIPEKPEASQPAASARYTFQQVKDGYLRLETQTGAVSFCGPRAVGWACQAVPEERAALDKEITQLQGEISALKKQLAENKPTAKDDEFKLKLPTREEMDQARAFVEEAWRRVLDMVTSMQKDTMRKD